MLIRRPSNVLKANFKYVVMSFKYTIVIINTYVGTYYVYPNLIATPIARWMNKIIFKSSNQLRAFFIHLTLEY